MVHSERLSGPDRRVHISPLGHYLDRVWEVPIREDADRLWLVTDAESSGGSSREYRRAVVAHLRKVAPRMEIATERTEFWNFEEVVQTFSHIMHREVEAGNRVWVNISAGTKLQAVAGHLAAMAWGATSYYVIATTRPRPARRVSPRGRGSPLPTAWGYGGKIELPYHRLDRPDPGGLEVLRQLRFIGATGEVWRPKKHLLRAMEIHDMAGRMRVNRVLENLSKFPPKVEQRGATRTRIVRLTKEGMLTLLLFGNDGVPHLSGTDSVPREAVAGAPLG